MNQTLTIKELPYTERPYEKLELYGSSVLTDAELLAIIIRNGTVKERSTDLAMRVLAKHSTGLIGLHHLTLEELKEISGIGRVKAIQLKALAEISKRIAKSSYREKVHASSPSSVAAMYMEQMRYLKREHMMVVLLDTKYNIIEDHTLSIGTVNASLVNPREVFIHALKREAVNILLIHNHPSGNPEPSPDDIAITERVEQAGEIVGVKLIDHIVIGDGIYVSLKEQGYINN